MKPSKTLITAAAASAMAFGATAANADTLYLYNWSNYFPPSLVEKFEQETGVRIQVDSFASESEMLAKLQAGGGGYDIVVPGHRNLLIMIQQDLVAQINAHAMPNFSNVMEPHDFSPSDPNREYSAPYMWGTTGITYDSARVPGGELDDSWREYFEPREELRGQIASLNDMNDVWNAAAYYLGFDQCTEDPDEAQQILDLLMAQKDHVRIYSNDGTIDRMIAGEVAMHMQWNGAAHRVRNELPTARYMYPSEGVSFWSDNFAVPKDAPNMENAKTFLNWMMDPENAAEASNFTGYMNAIRGSGDYMNDELKVDPAINTPEEYADRLRGYQECSDTTLELKDRVWTRLKS